GFLTTVRIAGQTDSPPRVAGATSQQDAEKPAITVVVQDMTGALIQNADVSFLNEKTQEKTTFKTDDNGVVKPTNLVRGQYELTFETPNFCTRKIAHVTVPGEKMLTATLEVCGVVE